MSTIRTIYEEEPKFPATDQHPDAVRYRVGKHVVDAIGGEPTQEEVDAVLNPPAPPAPLTDGVLAALLVKNGTITQADVDTAAIAMEVKS